MKVSQLSGVFCSFDTLDTLLIQEGEGKRVLGVLCIGDTEDWRARGLLVENTNNGDRFNNEHIDKGDGKNG